MPLRVEAAAVPLYVGGLSMNRAAEPLGVSTPSVQAWIERFAEAYAQKPGPEGRAVVVGLGEMWRRLKKPDEPWAWKARDRASGRSVDRGCGGRDRTTLERLPARLRRRDPRPYRADDRAAHAEAIPQGRPRVGEDGTRGIGRDHARRRHRPARFRRRSIVVSKAGRVVDASIAPFARFGGDDKIGDPASMLA
jgi:insertion element IS1 protein InsB